MPFAPTVRAGGVWRYFRPLRQGSEAVRYNETLHFLVPEYKKQQRVEPLQLKPRIWYLRPL